MSDDALIYLDNAATSFPKSGDPLRRAMEQYLAKGVSPGRGSYDSAVEMDELVAETRRRLAAFFGAPDPDRVIFTANATDALNLGIMGLVRPGSRVVASRLEHNSVLRPLHHLHQTGAIALDLVPFDGSGFVDPDDVSRAIRKNTSLVVITHASNVLGTVQPVAEIARACSERGVPILIDAAQTAGVIPVSLMDWGVSAVAFTGHKGLMAAPGSGGLVIAPDVEVKITRFGGTGVDSLSLEHTKDYPHRLEAGTLNLLGVMSLGAAVEALENGRMAERYRHEMALTARLLDGLRAIPGVTVYGAEHMGRHVSLLSFNIAGVDPDTAGSILDGDWRVACRVGLHCAPLVHESLGTSPRGTVRFSLGAFNTAEQMDTAVSAVGAIAAWGARK